MQFSYLHFKHANILPALDELSRSNFFLGSKFFISGVCLQWMCHKVLAMKYVKCWGVCKCKYENCIFIRERLLWNSIQSYDIHPAWELDGNLGLFLGLNDLLTVLLLRGAIQVYDQGDSIHTAVYGIME